MLRVGGRVNCVSKLHQGLHTEGKGRVWCSSEMQPYLHAEGKGGGVAANLNAKGGGGVRGDTQVSCTKTCMHAEGGRRCVVLDLSVLADTSSLSVVCLPGHA
jgi:hypothetical protein